MPNFKTSDGLTLYYSDQGEGIPVLCLAGLSRNSSDFSYIDGLLEGVRLIKMDYRGRGRSDWAKDHSSYNIPRESMDAIELMDHLGIERFSILGTSRGGLCAITIGALTKDRLQGVAFNDIGPVIEAEGLAYIDDYLGLPPAWKTIAEAAIERPKTTPGFANVPEARWREEAEKHYRQTEKGLALTYDPKLRDAITEAKQLEVPDLWPFFKALADIPLAFLRAENSNLLSAETYAELAAAFPNAIMAEVKDRGHIPFLDEPESLAALREWIARLPKV